MVNSLVGTPHTLKDGWSMTGREAAEQVLREAGFHSGNLGTWWRGAFDNCTLYDSGKAVVELRVPLTDLPALLYGGYTEKQVEKMLDAALESFAIKDDTAARFKAFALARLVIDTNAVAKQ